MRRRWLGPRTPHRISGCLFEFLTPRMIFRWTPGRLCGISCLAVGRIGLRRSATRAPAGRSHARGTGRLSSTPFRLYFARYRLAGIGLRLGRLATLVVQRDFLVVEVMSLKA